MFDSVARNELCNIHNSGVGVNQTLLNGCENSDNADGSSAGVNLNPFCRSKRTKEEDDIFE